MKQNQDVLFLLREPFSNTLQPLQPKLHKNIYDQENPKNTEIDMETNDENDDETVKISAFEENLHMKVEKILRKYGGFYLV